MAFNMMLRAILRSGLWTSRECSWHFPNRTHRFGRTAVLEFFLVGLRQFHGGRLMLSRCSPGWMRMVWDAKG